jgi:hypothetical protein
MMIAGALFGALAGCSNKGVQTGDGAVDTPVSKASSSTGTGTVTSTGSATTSAKNTGTASARNTATERTEETDGGRTDASTGTPTSAATQNTTGAWTGYFTSVKTQPSVTTATLTKTITGTNTATGMQTGGQTTSGAGGTATKTTTSVCYPTGSTYATTGTTTGLGTGPTIGVCATWDTIKLTRRNGLGFCPKANTAASVVIKRSADGSLSLSGEAFRLAAEATGGCTDVYSNVCIRGQAFQQATLTLGERDQLMSLVSAAPSGSCPHNGYCDPCLITTLSIDGISDEDWEGCCTDPTGPGSHRAGVRAIVAYIDSLVPKASAASVDASAGDAPRDSRTDR